MDIPEAVLSVLIGVGLAAACGFRIFVPLLVMSIAATAGHLQLSEGFAWIGTWPALVAFAVATGLEIAAYYIPWLDNLLDTVATPAAVVAGVIVVAACVTDMSPYLKWTLAVIAGGGAAGAVQALTVTTRGASTATTGGAANPTVSTVEAGSAAAVSTLSVTVPILALALVLAAGLFLVVRLLRRRTTAHMPAG
jgi:hypothetical protein